MSSEVGKPRGEGRYFCVEGRNSTVMHPPRGEINATRSTDKRGTPILVQFFKCFFFFISVIFFMNFFIIILISTISVSFVNTHTDGTEVATEYNSVFNDIWDQDSTYHQYVGIRDGENWCWTHNMWENVRIVNPSSRRKEEDEE